MNNKLLCIMCASLFSFGPTGFASSIFEPNSYLDEKAMIGQLMKFENEKINTDSCNSKTLRVKEVLSQFILLSSIKDTPGRTKGIQLSCKGIPEGNAVKGTNCALTLGEQIKLPNEPEGWSRNLFFAFDLKKKAINPHTFRCVDIP